MNSKIEITSHKDLKSGDIIQIVSNDRNCGIDASFYTAIVVKTESGHIAIPQDFLGWMLRAETFHVSWQLDLVWLLEQDVTVSLVYRLKGSKERIKYE